MTETEKQLQDVATRLEQLRGIRPWQRDNEVESIIGNTPYKVIQRHGVNLAVTSWEDIWSDGGTHNWFSATENIRAISTSANDASGGTGARTLTVQTLDGSFLEQDDITITMNGTTVTSSSSESVSRVNLTSVATTGTYHGSNAGSITVDGASSGNNLSHIFISGIGWGESVDGKYTVPANKRAIIRHVNGSHSATGGSIACYYQEGIDTVVAPFTSPRQLFFHDTPFMLGFGSAPKRIIEGPADIWFRSLNGTRAAVDFSLYVF